VGRLLNLEPFAKPVRNLAKVDAEYDKDKYAKLLEYYQQQPGTTLSDIRKKYYSPNANPVCYSMKDELFIAPAEKFRQFHEAILIDKLAKPISQVKTVIELGCGYGDNLYVLRNTFTKRRWLGGEYSQNAVKLASHLFTDCPDISVTQFNWYDVAWAILENLQEKALIFTRHSIEQLPQAKNVMPTFRKYQDRIAGVIHLEPVYELINKISTLGMMRQAYTLMNDYNTDLLATLKSMNVQILQTDTDIVGGNPLNPTSFIYWKFWE
jgi:hypothetical protein